MHSPCNSAIKWCPVLSSLAEDIVFIANCKQNTVHAAKYPQYRGFRQRYHLSSLEAGLDCEPRWDPSQGWWDRSAPCGNPPGSVQRRRWGRERPWRSGSPSRPSSSWSCWRPALPTSKKRTSIIEYGTGTKYLKVATTDRPKTSVADPDPEDPYVFGHPWSGSSHHQAKVSRKTLIPTVFWLLYDFLS